MLLSARPNLSQLALDCRLQLLDLIHQNGGHIGGSLSSLDILVELYFGNLFNFPKKYSFDGDNFILSAGHLAPALYVILSKYRAFSDQQLSTYSQFGSALQGHASTQVPGVLYSSGSLGQGLSFALGLAMGKSSGHVVCLTSDGEHQEGQIWEAIMAAGKFNPKNLINIVDYNKYQIDGSTQDIMPLDDLGSKYLRFGWTVYEFDGHDFGQLHKFLAKAKTQALGPICLLAHTVLGKGIPFMHYDYHYHDVKNLSAQDYQQARAEILATHAR